MNPYLEALIDILTAPFHNFEVFWLIIPLFLLWILLELYFGKSKNEELGWNTALSHAFTMVWINVNVIYAMFAKHMDINPYKIIMVAIFMTWGIFLMYLTFFHKIPKKYAYILTDPTPIFFLSILTIAWGYDVIAFNKFILINIIVIFVLLSIFMKSFRHFIAGKLFKEETIDYENNKNNNINKNYNNNNIDMNYNRGNNNYHPNPNFNNNMRNTR